MRVLIISRKTKTGKGGLNTFYAQIATVFPQSITISPSTLGSIFQVAFFRPTHVYLCDATLLPVGIFYKALLRKPLIVTAHGLDITFGNKLYQRMVSSLLPKTDAIILDSESTRKLLFGLPLKQAVKVISPGVTTSQFYEIKKMRIPDVNKNIVLTTVGNLVPRKGHVWFIKNVFPLLSKNTFYFVVGKGPEEKVIKKIIKEHRLQNRIFLFGQLENNELGYVLSKTDIYVSPNIHIEANFESFGIAALEAAAFGIPVVASDVDGISQAIHNGKNGLLVKPNPESFINAIKILGDRKLRKKIGTEAKSYSLKNFNWDKTGNMYTKLFASLYRN